MATIHVNRGGTNLGTFTEDEVRSGLQGGRFQSTDLGWREGMATWQPLSQFAEFSGSIPAAPPAGAAAPPPPVAAAVPPSLVAPLTSAPTPPPGARTGLPWENRAGRGLVAAFIETLQMVLTRPAEAYAVMRREGGFGDPLLYALIGGSVGAIAYFLYSTLSHALGLPFGRNPWTHLGMAQTGGIALLIVIPILVAAGVFIGSALVHLCLMIVGGARQSFETTFRVMSFTHGSAGVLQMIPFCGPIIACVWAFVVNCIGLARAHEIETWRAVVALLLPLIVCCGLAMCAGILIPAMMSSSSR